MTFALVLTQAPHASYQNGGYGADARQYWARQTQFTPAGPRIEAIAGALAPGGFAPVLVDNSGEAFLVRVADRVTSFSTLDYTPWCIWDEDTRQIIMGGFRERHKAMAYSDVTGDWREIDQPPWLSKQTGTGHFYGTIAQDSAKRIYWKAAKYDPTAETWEQIAAPTTPNGSNGSNYIWMSNAGQLAWHVGDNQYLQIYNPATDSWSTAASLIGSSQHSIDCYHPQHKQTLMVGGTYTAQTAILVNEDGSHVRVADCPGITKMSTGSWSIPHPDGCWLVRTSDPSPRLYAYWPGTDTWQDLGAAPDAALTYSTAAYDALRNRVYIVATTGLYVWQAPAFSGSAAFIDRVDAGDAVAIAGKAPVMVLLSLADASDAPLVVGAVGAADAVAPILAGAITVTSAGPYSIAIAWPAGSDNVGVASYEVSKDGGASYIDVGTTRSYIFTGLASSTSYALRVRAKDAAGNLSAPLSLTQATGAVPDTTAPVMAGAITLVDVASDAIQIAWLPGSDNVGVAAYEVSKDGGSSYVSVGNVLGYLFTGLPSSTVHQLRVRAKDAAGNTSAALALAQATLAPPAPPASVPRIGVAANGELVALLGSSSRGLCVGITAAGKLLVMPSAPTTFPRVGSLANGQLMAIL